MVEGAYSKQKLTQYLLGSLPETEVERFDELSVTDNEFADALSAAENDLVDAYVQGELSNDVLEQFKSNYLASPLRREKVRFARAYQLFSARNSAAGAVSTESVAKPATARKPGAWFSRLLEPRIGLQWGLATAALVLLVAGGWLAFENIRLRRQMSQTAASRDALSRRELELQKELEGQRSTSAEIEGELARVRAERETLEQALKKQPGVPQTSLPTTPRIAFFVLTPQMRGVGKLAEVSLPADTESVAMQLELEPGAYTFYRVELLDQSNSKTLWRSGQLRASTKGDTRSVAVRFPAGLLKSAGVYFLRASGVSPNGSVEIAGDYPFRVVH